MTSSQICECYKFLAQSTRDRQLTRIDSYDGDDAPAKIEEPAVLPDPVPVAPPPIESSTGDNDTSHDPGPQIKDEDMYDNGQNGDTGSGWNGAPSNDGQDGQFNNGLVLEEEPPRIGIKEDG